jgi:two-component system LytT family response regulator
MEIVAEAPTGLKPCEGLSYVRIFCSRCADAEAGQFQVLELVGHDAAVFMTAYDRYAIRAFEGPRTVDYLLEASARAFCRRHSTARERLGEARLPGGRGRRQRQRRDLRRGFRARRREKVRTTVAVEIDYVQAQDDYVSFKCEGRELLKEQTLAEVEAMLDPAKFVRIHRSFVMNLDRLARVELDERENRIAILNDGRRLPVSRAGYARLSSLLAL